MENLLFEWLMLGFIALVAWVCYIKPETRFPKWFAMITTGVMGVLSIIVGLILLLGWILMSGMIPLPHAAKFPPLPPHTDFMGFLTIAMGLMAVPVLIRPFRVMLSKTVFRGLDPDKPVHIWALYVFILALMTTVSMLTVLYDPQAFLASIQDIPLYLSAAFNLVMFTVMAFFCSGVFLHRNLKETARALGLQAIPKRTALNLVVLGVLISILSQVLEWIITPFIPSDVYQQLQQIMNTMQSFQGVGETVIASLVIGVCAGIGEEFLFRGLIQPVFGLVPTSILFALIHIHYGPTVLLLELFMVGMALGWVRKRYNTTASIVTHASFDMFAISSSLFLHVFHH